MRRVLLCAFNELRSAKELSSPPQLNSADRDEVLQRLGRYLPTQAAAMLGTLLAALLAGLSNSLRQLPIWEPTVRAGHRCAPG